MKTKSSSETGQALIILVLGMIVFLGFVALAIDGSMVYSDRRQAQNGSDSASLAAAGVASLELENYHITANNWDCSSAEMANAINTGLIAAVNRAADNNFAIDYDDSDYNSVSAQCGQEYVGGYLDRYIDFTTHISTTTTTSFLQLVYDGPVQNRVIAITRVRPRQPLVFGHAIVALDDAACQGQQHGATFHGNATIYVIGGGVFSNGCLRANGHPTIDVTDGTNDYVVDFDGCDDCFSPLPNQVDNPIPPSTYHVPLPDCSDPDAHVVNNMNGGNLEPGLWCVNGEVRINGNDTLIGEGVTIYVPTGGVRINGNATVQLSAPARSPDPSPALPGILFYLPPDNHNNHGVEINGNSDSFFQGVVLAPGTNVDMSGTGAVNAFRTQVIGWTVEVGGAADAYVVFNDEWVYSRPTFLELFK